MTGAELNDMYGAMIMPDAQVAVPSSWMPAVHEAMTAFVELPTPVRAFFIVVGIVEFADGIEFQIAGAMNHIDEDGRRMIADIIARAREAAKSGVH